MTYYAPWCITVFMNSADLSRKQSARLAPRAVATGPVLTRTQAAKLVEEIRELTARALADGKEVCAAELADLFSRLQLAPLERCTGEAHSNAHIDNCMCCAPRWGWVGPKVTVR